VAPSSLSRGSAAWCVLHWPEPALQPCQVRLRPVVRLARSPARSRQRPGASLGQPRSPTTRRHFSGGCTAAGTEAGCHPGETGAAWLNVVRMTQIRRGSPCNLSPPCLDGGLCWFGLAWVWTRCCASCPRVWRRSPSHGSTGAMRTCLCRLSWSSGRLPLPCFGSVTLRLSVRWEDFPCGCHAAAVDWVLPCQEEPRH
jgi:hypothetical protein